MKKLIWAEIKATGKQIILERYRMHNGTMLMETVTAAEVIDDYIEYSCIVDDSVIVAFQVVSP